MIRYEKLDVEKLLAKYNVRNISKRGEEVQFSCPFPEHMRGDRNPSSSINTQNGRYHCFSCGRSGTIANFLADIEGVPLSVSLGWLEESVGSQLNKEGSVLNYIRSLWEKRNEKQTPKEIILGANTLDIFSVDWQKAYQAYEAGKCPRPLSYLFRRKFLPRTLQEYEIGYDKHSDRITIPIRNLAGELVGIKGRAVSSTVQPRYKSIGDKKGKYYGFPTCKVHNYIWGIHSAIGHRIVVEGELDAMWLRQNGLSGVALGGSNISANQIELLKASANSVTLMLDPDVAGKKAERQLAESLIGFMPVRIASLIDTDPAETEIETLKEIINNAQGALTHKIKQKTQ